jgi:hypothetical protein
LVKKRIIIICVISMFVTLASPYIFTSYFEKKPESLKQTVHFGGPLPFIHQQAVLNENDKAYPLEVDFQSPFKQKTNFLLWPFLISFTIFFAILFSLYTIFSRFFKKNDRYEE